MEPSQGRPDAHAKVGAALYSLPYHLIGQRLDARASAATVQFYLDGELVKTHPSQAKGRRTDWADLPQGRVGFFMRNPNWCRTQAGAVGAACAALVEELLASTLFSACARPKVCCASAGAMGTSASRLPASAPSRPATRPTRRSKASWPPAPRPQRSRAGSSATTPPPGCEGPRRSGRTGDDHGHPFPARPGAALSAPDRELETLDARLADARARTLGHVEFLQVLCEDELARREAAAVSRRLRAAHLPSSMTLEGFDVSYNQKLPAAQLRDLSDWSSSPPARGFVSTGRSGWARPTSPSPWPTQACRRGYDAMFVTASRMLADLAGGHADRSFVARMKRMAKPAVLVVDDFAMREFSLLQADDFYDYAASMIMPRSSSNGGFRKAFYGSLSA